MKTLPALLAVFALSALPAWAELVTDPETGLRTGTLTVNGATYTIQPGADLRRANLSGANLSGADLALTDLRGADLSGADLTGVLSGNIISNPETILPSGYQLIDGQIVQDMRQPAITACGLVNATTFFIEFEPAGTGYRVMSSSTLDFGDAVEVTPTVQPTSATDNRFEFTASGLKNFYRIEPVP